MNAAKTHLTGYTRRNSLWHGWHTSRYAETGAMASLAAQVSGVPATCGTQSDFKQGSWRSRLVKCVVVATLGAMVVVPGCAEKPTDNQPTAADKALSDPMNFGPRPGKADSEPKRDTSSDSDGLKKDLHNVFNP